MMRNEFHPCTKEYCFVRTILLTEAISFWPLEVYAERGPGGLPLWNFYVNWSEVRGKHKNRAPVCEKHHKQLLLSFGSEMAADVREQEATDRWMIQNRSKL